MKALNYTSLVDKLYGMFLVPGDPGGFLWTHCGVG